jgi:hypothetical protein
MFEYEYHYKIDKVNSQILGLLSIKPRRLAELQHHIGQLTAFAVLHRMNKLEATGLVVAERIPHTSTTYRLAPAKKENDEESGVGAPLKNDLQTVKDGNDARIRE